MKRSTEGGFILLEVMMALVVLLFGTVAVFQSFRSSLRVLRETHEVYAGSLLLEGQILELEQSGYWVEPSISDSVLEKVRWRHDVSDGETPLSKKHQVSLFWGNGKDANELHVSTTLPSNRTGFSLIEMIVALAIGVIAAVSLVGVFQNGLRVWRHTEKSASLQGEARAALDRIARDFRNSSDVPGVGWTMKDQDVFFSTVEDVRSPQNDRSRLRHIVKVAYQIVPDPTGAGASSGVPKTVLQCVRQGLSPSGLSEPGIIPMTAHPTTIQWEYAYTSPDAPLIWSARWDSHDMPVGIRVRLTLQDESSSPQVFAKTIFLPITAPLPWLR